MDKPDIWEIKLRYYLEHLSLERGMSPATIDNYGRDLRAFAAYLRQQGCHSPEQLHIDLTIGFLTQQAEAGLEPATRARRLSAIRGWNKFEREQENQLLRALPEQERQTVDLCRNLSDPKKGRHYPFVLTQAQALQLLSLPDSQSAAGRRDRAILEFLYGCGLRATELISLTLHDLVPELELLRCVGKGDKERLIPIGSYAKQALDDYLQWGRTDLLRGKNTQQIFLNQRGGQLSRSGLWRIVEGYGQRMKPPLAIHPHTLRHSAATHMLDNGADLRIIQEFLGHTNISTTQVYTHLTKSELKSAYFRMHPRYDLQEQEGEEQ